MLRARTQPSFSLSSLCTVVVCGSSTWRASTVSPGCQQILQLAKEPAQDVDVNVRCFSSKEFGGPSCSFSRQLQNTSEGTQSSAQQFISSWGHRPISFICIAHGCRVGVHTHLICKIKLGDVFEHMHKFIPGVKIECKVKFNFTLAALKAQETFFSIFFDTHAWILAFFWQFVYVTHSGWVKAMPHISVHHTVAAMFEKEMWGWWFADSLGYISNKYYSFSFIQSVLPVFYVLLVWKQYSVSQGNTD